MTKLLPLILILCMAGCVSKPKPQTVFYPKAELLTDTPRLIGIDTGVVEYWDFVLRDPEGKGLVAMKKPNEPWIIQDSALALKVALFSLEQNLEQKKRMPVYILDGDTLTLYPGDTIRIVTCKEDNSYFRTVKNKGTESVNVGQSITVFK